MNMMRREESKMFGPVLGIIGAIALVIAIPILIWHFLIFPNLDGVVQDLEWYNYDMESQHFLYWLGFWTIGLSSGIFGLSKSGGKNS
jgi:hypothetical protein